MNPTKSTTKAKATDPLSETGRMPRVENSTDATRGHPLVQRVQMRRAELETALSELPTDRLREREEIELAIAGVDSMLTGDLDNVPDVVASDMSHWLERNKHLAEMTPHPNARPAKAARRRKTSH